MAKQKAADTGDGENVIAFTTAQLTGDLKKQVQHVKGPILTLASSFGNARAKALELGPKVMRLFATIQYHFSRIPGAKTFGFVDFVRLIDPATPKAANEYRAYRTYYTLDYMRREAQRAGRKSGAAGETEGAATTAGGALRDRSNVFTARLLKMLMELAPLAGKDPEWIVAKAVEEGKLSKNVQTRLHQRIAATEPLFTITVPKNAKIGIELHHMETPAPEQAPAHPLTQAGRSVHVRAAANALGASLNRDRAAATGNRGRARKSA